MDLITCQKMKDKNFEMKLKNDEFDLQKEMLEYWKSDVMILKQTCLKSSE